MNLDNEPSVNEKVDNLEDPPEDAFEAEELKAEQRRQRLIEFKKRKKSEKQQRRKKEDRDDDEDEKPKRKRLRQKTEGGIKMKKSRLYRYDDINDNILNNDITDIYVDDKPRKKRKPKPKPIEDEEGLVSGVRNQEKSERIRKQPQREPTFFEKVVSSITNSKRGQKRDSEDIATDGENIVKNIVTKMNEAAEEDRILNEQGQPATAKTRLLPHFLNIVQRVNLQEELLDYGILRSIRSWLLPLPDKSLPNVTLRTSIYQALNQFHVDEDYLTESNGLGKLLVQLRNHSQETEQNKKILHILIEKWYRIIFKLTTDYKTIDQSLVDVDLPSSNQDSNIILSGKQTHGTRLQELMAKKKKRKATGGVEQAVQVTVVGRGLSMCR